MEEAAIFTIKCQECGGVCCYADDSTYSAAGSDQDELSEKLSHKYTVMADFLTLNKLKVNDDKTHLLVMSTWQKRMHRDTSTITINTPTATITPSEDERLLGAQVHHNMGWKEHLLENKDGVMKSLNKRIGALRKVSRIASFKTRKMLADGIFISKLIYLMPLWMGCDNYLVRALQVSQNKAARLVAKLDRYTPARELMKQCGWLSVRQLIMYHSLVMLHKVFQNKKPVYLYQRVTAGSDPPNTRQAAATSEALTALGIQDQPSAPTCELSLSRQSWCWSSVHWYSQLPPNLRSETEDKAFKTRLKDWVSENIENLMEEE